MKTFEQFQVNEAKGKGYLSYGRDSSKIDFSNFDNWKSQASRMNLKTFSGTSPSGEVDGKYWKAKDKNGNTVGEFQIN